eukprot:scaffold91_cov143-Skeletonema_menzelii.AAC.24
MTPGPFLTAGAPSEKAPGYQSKIPPADRYFSLVGTPGATSPVKCTVIVQEKLYIPVHIIYLPSNPMIYPGTKSRRRRLCKKVPRCQISGHN